MIESYFSNDIEIKQINDSDHKKTIARKILTALPEWFGIQQSRENYINECSDQILFAAFHATDPIGFICLKETGKSTAEISVMGVLNEYHRKGVGKRLFMQAKETAALLGYSFIQVKTVKMGLYKEYDQTNMFYLSMGFKEFEVLPVLWDEHNPCQIYVMYIQ